MAREILAFPESMLPEVIRVLEVGLSELEYTDKLSERTRVFISEWIKDCEDRKDKLIDPGIGPEFCKDFPEGR